MKYLAVISIVIALLALAACGIALKIGLALPPKLEDMTCEGDVPQATNISLCVSLSNQTGRELAVAAVLDGSVSFGGSLIRDQHFGGTGIGIHAEPGRHVLELMVAGRPVVTNTLHFSTEPGMTNRVYIDIFPDSQTKYRFKMKQSTSPLGVL